MIDSDLAQIYQCKNGTKSINQAVKRHIERFPERFMFQLNEKEANSLWFQVETANQNLQCNTNLQSQVGTAKMTNFSKIRTLPYAFTEQGVAMLATILRTEVAIKVSVKIMRTFVAMRKYISNNLLEQKYINNQVIKYRRY